MQLGIVDIGLILLDAAFVLGNERYLRVELLSWNGILGEQALVAIQIDLAFASSAISCASVPSACSSMTW